MIVTTIAAYQHTKKENLLLHFLKQSIMNYPQIKQKVSTSEIVIIYKHPYTQN